MSRPVKDIEEAYPAPLHRKESGTKPPETAREKLARNPSADQASPLFLKLSSRDLSEYR